MNYAVILHPDAVKEYRALDGSIQKLVKKQLEKISEAPRLGELLGNKYGMDLSGYRKMYVDHKRVRIIYRIIEDTIVVEVIAIGERNDFDVYKNAAHRLGRE